MNKAEKTALKVIQDTKGWEEYKGEPSSACDACKVLASRNVRGGRYDSELDQQDLDQASVLEVLAFDKPLMTITGKGEEAASYEVYTDWSLLFTNNAESEAWASAGDFVSSRLLDLEPHQLDDMDLELLKNLGYADND